MDGIKISTSGKLILTQGELLVLQGLLDNHDRAGYYMAYHAMTGSDEIALQARIASFSGPVGGVAFASNRVLQELFGPGTGADPQYAGIYKISQDVAEASLDAINSDIEEDGSGNVSDDLIYDSAKAAWNDQGLGSYFPGNLFVPLEAVSTFVTEFAGTVLANPNLGDLAQLTSTDGALEEAFDETIALYNDENGVFSPGTLAALLGMFVHADYGKNADDLEEFTAVEGPGGHTLYVDGKGHVQAVLGPDLANDGAVILGAAAIHAAFLALPAIAGGGLTGIALGQILYSFLQSKVSDLVLPDGAPEVRIITVAGLKVRTYSPLSGSKLHTASNE